MISQKKGVDVASTLLEVARNDPSEDVRGDAIFWLGGSRTKEAIPALDSILFRSKDEDLQQRAIFGLANTHDEQAMASLRRAVEDEKLSDDIRGQALFWLGNADHSAANLDYLKALFKKTHNEDLRSRIVQSISNTNTPESAAWLVDVAGDKSYDVDTRKNAIFWASQHKAVDIATLNKLYDQSKGDEDMQTQLLWIYSTRHEPAALDKLMDIAKNDPNTDRRKSALFWLGQKNDPRAKAFIRDLIYR
jgi:HEAT repeat protein